MYKVGEWVTIEDKLLQEKITFQIIHICDDGFNKFAKLLPVLYKHGIIINNILIDNKTEFTCDLKYLRKVQ